MLDVPSTEKWATLRRKRPLAEDALSVIELTSSLAARKIQMAMDNAGDLHLLIAVDHGPQDFCPQDLNGLRVRYRKLESGEVLDLVASPPYEAVFNAVCVDVIEAVDENNRDPWLAVTAILRKWQAAWRPARKSMDYSVQVGLFGELFVLEKLMLPSLGSMAISLWSGPEGERHDFVGEKVHIEVKTTRKSRHEHEISRIDQLSVPDGCQLLLVSVLLEQSVGGTESVATGMDAVIDLLRGDMAAMDCFMTKMVAVGWNEEMRNSGELLRFFVRKAVVYAVDDEFPRFPESLLLPTGIVSLRYTVDLANLPTLDLEEVKALLTEGK